MNQETFISMLWILIAVTCIELSTTANAQSRKTTATSMREDANNNTEPDHPSEYNVYIPRDVTVTQTPFQIVQILSFAVFLMIEKNISFRARPISKYGGHNLRRKVTSKN